jgi:hypothetical protein
VANFSCSNAPERRNGGGGKATPKFSAEQFEPLGWT